MPYIINKSSQLYFVRTNGEEKPQQQIDQQLSKQGFRRKQKWRRTVIEEGQCRCSVLVGQSHRRAYLLDVTETHFVLKKIIPIKTFLVSESDRKLNPALFFFCCVVSWVGAV